MKLQTLHRLAIIYVGPALTDYMEGFGNPGSHRPERALLFVRAAARKLERRLRVRWLILVIPNVLERNPPVIGAHLVTHTAPFEEANANNLRNNSVRKNPPGEQADRLAANVAATPC